MKKGVMPVNVILLLVSLLSTLSLNSQELTSIKPNTHIKENFQGTPWEEIYLHSDRVKYIAGEDIWFSIYTIDMEKGKLSARNAVAYVELLNPWNMPVIQSRFQLSGGRGEGNFSLPDSLSSGTYTIRAYTNWMKNFLPDNCYTQDIDIFNSFKDSGFRREASSGNNVKIKQSVAKKEKEKSSVTVAADSIFNRREKVTLKFETHNSNEGQSSIYDLSISVTPCEISEEPEGIKEYLERKKAIWENILSGIKAPPRYSFESAGHNLSVLIKYRENNISDSADYIYMSIQGKVAEFRYAGRDTAGRFNFILPVDDKFRNLILQPEHANNNMVLEIEPSFSWILPASYSFNDTLTDSQLDVFSKLSFNYQAAKIYGTKLKKEAETNDDSNLKKRRFYGIPEMEISLDDYIKLPSMQEIFFELLPGIIIRPRKSGYIMQITNPLTGVFYDEPPLVMIDGVIINDLTVLVDLNPEIVERIEVVKTPYLVGDLILHGVVNVITRTGNFSSITMPDYAIILPYRVIDKPSKIIAPDYSDEQNRSNRIPDLRNTLYWNPSVKTDKKGNAEIAFWTSDLPGSYTINIQGISVTGEKVSLHKSFIVR
jgi:hypothetical protein